MSHFEADCRAINDACAKNPQAVLAAGVMVLLSIQQPFHTIVTALEDVKARGRDSRFLWGWKRTGFDYLMHNYEGIMSLAHGVRLGRIPHKAFVRDLMAVPGMGIAKASFYSQLLVGEGACLDQHNLGRLGLGIRAFDFDKGRASRPLCDKKIALYVDTWQAHGDSAHWWNSWCDTVAAYHDLHFRDGGEVSALHRACLNYAFDANAAPF